MTKSEGRAGAVLIVGCGLIGSSLARVIRARGLADEIVVHDPDPRVGEAVLSLKLADRVIDAGEDFAGQADLVAVCAPPRAIADAARASLVALKPTGAMFDVGSVKGAISAQAASLGPRFVPAHPIAGTERSGPEAGLVDLFDNRWCILTPDGAAPDAVAQVEAFWRGCGARVTVMEPGAHDALLAATSHLPHLIAYALTSTAADETGGVRADMVRYSAGGFRDFTRIAASDPVMWRDVFVDNRDAVLEALDLFERRLARLRSLVQAGDGAALSEAFTRTRDIRAAIVQAGQETAEPDFGRHAQPPRVLAGDAARDTPKPD